METIENAEYLVADWWQDPSNRLVVLACAIGSPLLIAIFRDHFWAQPALQVYILTFSVVAFLWTVRKLRWRRHTMSALIAIGMVHASLMTGIVITNYTFPQINRWPVMLYGLEAALLTVELSVLASILSRLGARYGSEQEELNKKDLN